jgi:tRNA(fMet)-specific endonuclease VapC
MFSLDTNTVIGILTGRSPSARTRLIEARAANAITLLSPVVLLELWYGAEKSAYPDRNRANLKSFLASPIEVLTFDASDAMASGEIRAFLERSGTPIGPNDLQIAGQALARGLTVVTNNEREFRRVPNLSVTNWMSA